MSQSQTEDGTEPGAPTSRGTSTDVAQSGAGASTFEKPADAEATPGPSPTQVDVAQADVATGIGGAAAAGSDDSEAGDHEAGDHEAGDHEVGDPDGGDDAGDAAASDAAGGDDSSEGGAKKKKRRRRRKKKSSAGDVAAVGSGSGGRGSGGSGSGGRGSEGGGSEGDAPHSAGGKKGHAEKKDSPFVHFIEGAGQRHAFSAGEVVAGRVERVADGVIVVDLFGKAMASSDELEPRQVAHAPESAQPVASAEPAASGEAAESAESAAIAVDAQASVSGAEAHAVLSQAHDEQDDAHDDDAHDDDAHHDDVHADDAHEDGEEGTSPGETAAIPVPVVDAALAKAIEELEAFERSEPPAPPEIGSIFRGRVRSVSESGHIGIVNRDVDRAAAKAAIEQARAKRQRVRGVVFGFNRGGFDVLVHGIRVFCPARGMALTPIADPREWVGKKLEFSLPTTKTGKSIVVTRRSILEREARKMARDRLKELEPGQTLHGKITHVRDYGVLVDVGEGVEGLVHQSEVSWRRGVRPADVVRPGDEVQVQVLKVQPANRKDRFGKLSLSIRLCQPDPWDDEVVLAPGVPRDGKVVSVTEFGAFVELAPGVEGLVHISELGNRAMKHASEAVSVGDTLHVLVERVDKKQRRITLSKLTDSDMSAVAGGAFDPSTAPRSLKPGTHVMVVIERADHHGVHVQVQGVLGRKGRGYIPNRDIGSLEDPKNALAVGAVIEAKITGVDRDGGLRCSIKGKQLDDERKAVKEYRREAARQGFGTFGDLLKAKLGQSGEGHD